MRLLLIEEDAERCRAVRERLASWQSSSELVVRRPVRDGPLAPEFLAQGFDAVVLGIAWPGGRGLEWLRRLSRRAGFAPLVLLTAERGDAAAREAAALGACPLALAELAGSEFERALTAAERRQDYARALWRSGPGRDLQCFSGAFVRGYRRVRQLSAGALSDLYLAESEQAGALIALKVMRDRHAEGGAHDPFARFLQEYEIAQRVVHPGIVRAFDLGVSDEHAWLVMEYFPRGDLRRRMRAGMTPRSALRIAARIAHALEALHAAGVLHRDLKPGNVMLRDDGSVALIDFGLSKDVMLDLGMTERGLIFGTPHYMSPEQGHGQPLSARSDLYSLGVILYEMLTGKKPYRADNSMLLIYKHRNEPLPQLSGELAWLQPLLERLLAKEAADRFASAVEAAAALEQNLRRMPQRRAGT
jgi:serine/threonine protein kinase